MTGESYEEHRQMVYRKSQIDPHTNALFRYASCHFKVRKVKYYPSPKYSPIIAFLSPGVENKNFAISEGFLDNDSDD